MTKPLGQCCAYGQMHTALHLSVGSLNRGHKVGRCSSVGALPLVPDSSPIASDWKSNLIF
eukprot:1387464-Amphidinium_carterae.1